MAYTPELSMRHSRVLRRVAWSLGMPMTKAMSAVFDYLERVIESQKVCEACRDKTRCRECAFNS